MKKKKRKISEKKAGIGLGFVAFLVVAIMFMYATFPTPVLQVEDGEWNVIWKGNIAKAENTLTGDVSGWLSTFCLDYAEDPTVCMPHNATNGAYDGWGNVSGYVDTDDTVTDLASEDPFYFVVRCRFNDTICGRAGVLCGNRCAARLTVTGDETITDVELLGNDTVMTGGGGAFISANATHLYINFVWDDSVDGYIINDDGALAWNITILAKY